MSRAYQGQLILDLIRNYEPGFKDAYLLDIDKKVTDFWGKFPKPITRWTKSRDALFDARPPNHDVTISIVDKDLCQVSFFHQFKQISTFHAKTEQLAELGALIILKEYIRVQKMRQS